jgi:hypothetical protein
MKGESGGNPELSRSCKFYKAFINSLTALNKTSQNTFQLQNTIEAFGD